jgi:hypothetical protein
MNETRIHGPFAPPHPFAAAMGGTLNATPSPCPPAEDALARAHAALYAAVPSFDCEAGCTACCGMVPMTRWEWDQVEDRRAAGGDCRTCPYAAEGSCAIHADRPLLCRLFGAVDHPAMRCPKGRGPARMLSAQDAAGLMHAYQQLLADS